MKLLTFYNWLPALMDMFTFYGGGGSDAPDPPNYQALAKEQAKYDLDAQREATRANRVNQETPWGSITWEQEGGGFDQANYDTAMGAYQQALAAGGGGGTGEAYSPANPNFMRNYGTDQYGRQVTGGFYNPGGMAGGIAGGMGGLTPPKYEDFVRNGGGWKQKMTLDPETQRALDFQQKTQADLSGTAAGLTGRVNDSYANPFDWDAAPDVWNADWTTGENGGMAIDTVKNALMSRLSPDLLRNREREEARMSAMGVGPGATEAWGRSQNLLGRNENDAAMQSLLKGIGEYGNIREGQITDRNRFITEGLTERNMPLDELIKIQNAAGKVMIPDFPGFAQQGVGQSAQVAQAGQASYNAAMQKYNAENSGGGSPLLGALGTRAGYYFGGPVGGAIGGGIGGALGGK